MDAAGLVNGNVPEVTVLVPIYNVERYLRECLDSLRRQTFIDFEVICINDGSTDSSKEIIEEYLDADPRFRAIDKPNSGYGASMNMGLDCAKGTYVAILESDDIFADDALERLHDAAVRFDAQVVKGDFNLYWSVPEVKRELAHVVEGIPLGCAVKPIDEPRIFYAKSSIWSALYLRSFLHEKGIRFLETPGASYQDTAFNIKVWLEAERAVFIDDAILDYRQDNEQSSVNSPMKVFCVCDEYEEIDSWLSDRGHSERAKAIVQRAKYNNYLWNYDRLTDGLDDEFLERFAREFKEAYDEGVIDPELFEPWTEADLNALMDSPARFKACRDDTRAPGKLNTFKHYYRLGGFPLIVKVLRYKKEHS